jgi:hypothetical protein
MQGKCTYCKMDRKCLPANIHTWYYDCAKMCTYIYKTDITYAWYYTVANLETERPTVRCNVQ